MSGGHLFGLYVLLLAQAHIFASYSTFMRKDSKAGILIGVSHSSVIVTLTFMWNPCAIVCR